MHRRNNWLYWKSDNVIRVGYVRIDLYKMRGLFRRVLGGLLAPTLSTRLRAAED